MVLIIIKKSPYNTGIPNVDYLKKPLNDVYLFIKVEICPDNKLGYLINNYNNEDQ